jgi:outer membrane receptor protein involved in Fe transport
VNNFSATRSSFAFGISAAAIAVSLLAATPAQAQTAGTIRGEHGQPGASVTVTDTVTGRSVTTTVNEDGTFIIVGLRPSTYRVEGSGLAEDVTVPVGQIVTIDAAPQTAEAETGGEIIVEGRRDRTEVRTATVTTNVSQAQIENLPQNERNFLNFAALAPGVVVSPSGGDKRIQAGALSADQTNIFIDGLSLKNPVNHGGVAGQNFSPGNPFPQLAVQEFKVDTQNFKAEYEQAGSAIITAVTKTGGTEFHGDVFGQFQPKSFIGRPFFDRPGEANNPNGTVPKPDYQRWQYGGDLGGPIIPEKLHFFLAYEATDQKLPSTAVNIDPAAVPADIAAQNGSYGQTFKQDLYFAKLSLFATENDTIDLSHFRRDEQNLRDFGGRAVPSHGHNISSNGRLYQIEWDHRGDDWLNEFTIAYNTFSNGTPRVTDGPEILLTRGLTTDVAAELGAHSFVQNDRQKTWTLKNNLTLDRGPHIIKAGVKLARTEMSRLEDFRSNGTFWFAGTSYTGFDSAIPWQAAVSTIPVEAASVKNTQIGLFVQDDWTPDEHWTINAGLRWDYETNAKNEDFVTPPNVAAALRAYPGWQAAGINPEDYISTGNNRKPYWKAFQPRLGISYDVHGDRDLVFFAGAGRYYDRPLFIVSGIETIKNYYQSVTTLQFCDAAGLPTCQSIRDGNNGVLPPTTLAWNPSFRDVDNLRAAATATGTGGDIWLLNNKTKLPYSDQFNVGVRKRFGDWTTSLTFSHVRSHNLFRYVRGNRFSNGWYSRILQRDANGNVIGCTDGGNQWVVDNFPNTNYPACPAQFGDLAGFDGKLNIGSNKGKAHYTGVFLQADKPYTRQSGWGVTTTFTWQRARTNVGSELNSDEFFAGPDETQFGWQNVQGVPKWNFVATGIVGLPLDFTLSGTLNLNSGPAFGSILAPWNSTVSPPDGACCIANLGGVYFPRKDIAYKTLDLRLAKSFRTPWGHEVTADFQVYNLFDWVNRNYSGWGAGAGDNPTFEENATVGNARTFQAGLKYSF